MGDGPQASCSVTMDVTKPYVIHAAFGGYSEAGTFKPFEELPDLDGDGKPEFGMTMEESTAWTGDDCLPVLGRVDFLTDRERLAVLAAARSGQNAHTFRRTSLVQLSSTASMTSLAPHGPLIDPPQMNAVAKGVDMDLPFAVPLPNGESVRIGDVVQFDQPMASGMFMILKEKRHIETLDKPDGTTSISADTKTSTSIATADDLRSQFSLDGGDASSAFRVVNIAPGPIEDGRVAHELTRLSLVPEAMERIPETSDFFTRDDGARVLDTTTAVLEVPARAPALALRKKGWFDWLFK